jgi:hypothetical protein
MEEKKEVDIIKLKEIRENVLLYLDINASNTHTRTINLNIVPDKCIVRQLSYHQTTASTQSLIISADFVDSLNPWLGIIKHNLISTPNTELYPLNKSKLYNGQTTLKIYRQQGATLELIDVGGGFYAGGEMVILLEFIKYV